MPDAQRVMGCAERVTRAADVGRAAIRRRPQHQQRLRIVAGGDKQERAERAGERSREGEKQMGG
eukprot:123312-Rhodomonas_salina.2